MSAYRYTQKPLVKFCTRRSGKRQEPRRPWGSLGRLRFSTFAVFRSRADTGRRLGGSGVAVPVRG
jgi:hypothetical protein